MIFEKMQLQLFYRIVIGFNVLNGAFDIHYIFGIKQGHDIHSGRRHREIVFISEMLFVRLQVLLDLLLFFAGEFIKTLARLVVIFRGREFFNRTFRAFNDAGYGREFFYGRRRELFFKFKECFLLLISQ